MSAVREAFDLHIKACRKNVYRQFKSEWNKLYWWKLIYTDTKDNVCNPIKLNLWRAEETLRDISYYLENRPNNEKFIRDSLDSYWKYKGK